MTDSTQNIPNNFAELCTLDELEDEVAKIKARYDAVCHKINEMVEKGVKRYTNPTID